MKTTRTRKAKKTTKPVNGNLIRKLGDFREKFGSSLVISENNKQLKKNNEPELIDKGDYKEWSYTVDEDGLFTDQGKTTFEEKVPNFDYWEFWLEWLLSQKWYFLIFLLSALTLTKGQTLINWLQLGGISHWLLKRIANILDYQPWENITILALIIWPIIAIQLITFIIKEIWNIPSKIRTLKHRNELIAQEQLLQRYKEYQAKKKEKEFSRLEYLEYTQGLTVWANKLLEEQIIIDQQCRQVLEQYLGENNVPKENNLLAPLVFDSLSRSFYRKKDEIKFHSDKFNTSNI